MPKRKVPRPDNWDEMGRREQHQWCIQNKVIDWSVHKHCEEHGLTQLWLRDFFHPSQTAFCANRNCISKQISKFLTDGRVKRILNFAQRLCGREDIIDAVIDSMLHQVRQGRPTIIHATFMRWVALACLKGLQKQDVIQAKQKEMRSAIIEYLHGATDEFIAGAGYSGAGRATATNGSSTPEALYIEAELLAGVSEQFGAQTMLWLLGEMSDRDYARLEGIKLSELQAVKDQVKDYYLQVHMDGKR